MKEYKSDIKEKSYTFSLKVIHLVRSLPNDHVSRIISAELLRSATSIGANIMEAQAGSSKKDFTNYLSIALKSANESKYWLSLMKDSGMSNDGLTETLLAELRQIANILGSSLVTLKKQSLVKGNF